MLANDVHPRPLGPDLQLVGGGGPEGIRRAEEDPLALLLQPGGQLADGGGLAHAVDADEQHHRRGMAQLQGGVPHLELFRHDVPQGVLYGVLRAQALGVRSVLQLPDDVGGGLCPHIREDQRVGQIVIEFIVHFFPEDIVLPGFFQLIEKAHVFYLTCFYLIFNSLERSFMLMVSTRLMPRSCMVTP